MDEAGQISDLDLIELIVSKDISKLILIGDHRQLPPTVFSLRSRKSGLEISFLQRVLITNMPITLHQQYRMNSEICSFPSRLMYDGKLTVNKPPSDQTLHPYMVFDLNSAHI